MTGDRATPATRTHSSRATLLVVCASVFFSVLNGTMTNVALPVIGEDLSVEPARLGWIITGYLLVYGVSVPFYGRLADLYGGRRLFVIGLLIFAGASLACAVAVSYPMLLASRLVQALGASAIPGLGMALISQQFPAGQRGSAMGYVSATVGTGAAVGPTLGGILAGAFNWHFLFLFSALAGLLIPFALRSLPEGDRRPSEGLDLVGGVLVSLMVGGALLAATEGARGDLLAPQVVWAVIVSIISALALSFRQRLTRFPFIPRDLVHNRRYLALIAASFCTMAVSAGTFLSLPLLLVQTNRLPPVQVGLALLPNALALAMLGPFAGRLADRIGGRTPVRYGLVVMILSQLLFSSVGAGASPLIVSLLALLHGVGFAFINSPLSTMVSLVIPHDRLSSGLSINSMCFFLGAGFGTALVAAVLTARGDAQSALNPLYSLGAVGFSDAFLLSTPLLVIGLLLTAVLPRAGSRSVPELEGSTPTGQPAAGRALRR